MNGELNSIELNYSFDSIVPAHPGSKIERDSTSQSRHSLIIEHGRFSQLGDFYPAEKCKYYSLSIKKMSYDEDKYSSQIVCL